MAINWYKIAQEEGTTFFHGTDSPPFDNYDPTKAVKGDPHYNPLGKALYATDKPEFAGMFGKNVYEVQIPKDAKIKRVIPSRAESVIKDIYFRAFRKVFGRDFYTNTGLLFRIELRRQLDKARYSPYEAIMESVVLTQLEFQDKAEEFARAIEETATSKFSKFDVVVFTGTNNPNDIFIGSTPTKEVLIFNEAFQKVFDRAKK